MNRWTLFTKLPDIGRVSIEGECSGDMVTFFHPSDEGSIVLRISEDRAREISSMDLSSQNRMNLKLVKTVIHVGKEYEYEKPLSISCPHCGSPMSWIDSDFIIHSIPWCDEWRESH